MIFNQLDVCMGMTLETRLKTMGFRRVDSGDTVLNRNSWGDAKHGDCLLKSR